MLDVLDSMDQVFIPHVTVRHILDELCSFPNMALHMALEYISTHDNVTIRSADFAHQLDVRGESGTMNRRVLLLWRWRQPVSQ